MSYYEQVSKSELENVMAQVITQGEIVDTRLYGRAVLDDLWARGYDVVKLGEPGGP
jgi:(2Fe-2S) ferredoxin